MRKEQLEVRKKNVPRETEVILVRTVCQVIPRVEERDILLHPVEVTDLLKEARAVGCFRRCGKVEIVLKKQSVLTVSSRVKNIKPKMEAPDIEQKRRDDVQRRLRI